MSFRSVPIYEAAFSLAANLWMRNDSGNQTHEQMLRMLRFLDRHQDLCLAIRNHGLPLSTTPVEVGGVRLPHPLIVGAGIVKDGRLSGHRSLPILTGAVEFGSFTSYENRGNIGETIQFDRYNGSRSVYNRVGLRNRGALDMSQRLREILDEEPIYGVWGVSLAPMVGMTSPAGKANSLMRALEIFQQRVQPDWFTLDLSCPTTTTRRDDEEEMAVWAYLRDFPENDIPIWVKIAPGRSDAYYQTVVRMSAELNIKAIIATNSQQVQRGGNDWGLSGTSLYSASLNACHVISQEIKKHGYNIDLVGCGGILGGHEWSLYHDLYGAKAGMYTTALYYRGILAAWKILREYGKH